MKKIILGVFAFLCATVAKADIILPPSHFQANDVKNPEFLALLAGLFVLTLLGMGIFVQLKTAHK